MWYLTLSSGSGSLSLSSVFRLIPPAEDGVPSDVKFELGETEGVWGCSQHAENQWKGLVTLTKIKINEFAKKKRKIYLTVDTGIQKNNVETSSTLPRGSGIM